MLKKKRKHFQNIPRIVLGTLSTIAHRTRRNQNWRKRKHKGVDTTRENL